MINRAYFDVANQVARAAMTGTALPSLSGKLLAHLKITAVFFEGDEVVTVDADTAQLVILAKNSAQNEASLIDTTATLVGTGQDARYDFEWAVADSVQLRAVLDAAVDPTQPVELRYQLIYEVDGKAETIGGPIYFENNFFRPETPAPEATLNTSWETLKSRLVAGSNVTLTEDDDAKTITIAATGGGGGGGSTAWNDITGKPSSFTPSAHASSHAAAGSDPVTLAQSQITGLVSDLAGKAASSHTHAQSDITGLVSDLAGKAASSHSHSDATSLAAGFMPASDKSKLDAIEAAADVTDAGNVGSAIHGSTAKTTPADDDAVPLIDSAASNVLKKLSWTNIKATLKTYFDTLYASISNVLQPSNNLSDVANASTARLNLGLGTLATASTVPIGSVTASFGDDGKLFGVSSVTGTVVTVGTGLSVSGIPKTLALTNTGITAGSYTNVNVTVDAQGRITAISNGSSGGEPSAHASTHTAAGSDPLTLSQSQITNLTTDLAAKASTSALTSHTSNTSNPHSVTKAQVGLGNVTDHAQLKASDLDTDSTFAANSDTKIPSQKAVKTALDAKASSSHSHSDATSLAAGFMPASDKSKLDAIEAAADVTDAGNVGSAIHGSTAKTTPADDDAVPLIDSAASNVLKKLSWTNVKATLKTYFDTLYASVSNVLQPSNNLSDVASASSARSNLGLGALATQSNITTGQIAGSIGSGNKIVAITSGLIGTTLTVGTGLTNTGTALQLANTAVTAGDYTLVSLTVDAQGRITAASSSSLDALLNALSTTQGAVIYRGASGWVALAPGTSGQMLQTNGSGANPSWATPAGGGDVVGPSSATDSYLAAFDGTTGKLLKAVNPATIGGGSGGTKTYAFFTALHNQPPASNFATLDTRNSIAVLDFDDATAEVAVFVAIMPEAASLGSGLSIRITWMATSATSGDVVWEASLERMVTDADSDSFDTAVTATTTTNATSGVQSVTTISLTTIDSVVAGNAYRLRIRRDSTSGSDTMSGDAELIAVEVRSAA